MSRSRSNSKPNPLHRRRLFVEQLEARLCLSGVPAFSSLPGADHTVYLDFDGHTTQNTTWNVYYNVSTIVSPPYDIDGDPNNFNATELQRIENAYKWVAEDFAPFEINVTTVDPGPAALSYQGSGDTQWGVRVVITDDTFANCGCGGHAFVGSFDDPQDEPVFVYNTSQKGVSEASTHEVGHAMGLQHDGYSGGGYYSGHGSGDTSWAPLMGVSYNRNVTQWSKGEYYTGTNTEDDLAIISSSTNGNGFGYRNDDHGNTDGSATLLTSPNLNGSGIIERNTDVDVFRFSAGAGSATINIDPASMGPNLDIKADLYDAGGALVASSNPSSTLGASFNLTLSGGDYYLHVEGTGTGSPSSSTPTGYTQYGSLGQYTVSGVVPNPSSLPALTIDDVTVNEAAGLATFTVTLSGDYANPVTVSYATSNDTALAGSDYQTRSGSLTFLSTGSQTIDVPIINDSTAEGTEAFRITLSDPVEAVISDGVGVGTIEDNDTDISINDVAITEGNLAKGKKNQGNPQITDMVFTVSLSNPVGHTVTVGFATVGIEATQGVDFNGTSGTLTFTANQTSKTITVQVIGDNDQEPDETFQVVLSGESGGNLADGVGVGTILDDDSGDGGGGGGGGGNGKGRNKAPREILMEDPKWWFEGPGHDHDHLHDHHHDHGYDHDHDALAQDAIANFSARSLQQSFASFSTVMKRNHAKNYQSQAELAFAETYLWHVRSAGATEASTALHDSLESSGNSDLDSLSLGVLEDLANATDDDA